MKQIKRSTIILALVIVALILKAIQEGSAIMGVAALFLTYILTSRLFLVKNSMKNEDLTTDFVESALIYKYLNTKLDVYAPMHEIYKQGNCDVLYEENDGVLLYDHKTNVYMGSARTAAGALDIVNLLPQDYQTFITYDSIFTLLENKGLKFQHKENVNHDVNKYYSK